MLRAGFSIFMVAVIMAAASTSAQRPTEIAEPLPSFGEPAISPDRSEVALISSGDIWTVPLAGGEARLLVSHPANESRPLYSPDGRSLAFISDRTGGGDHFQVIVASRRFDGLSLVDQHRLVYDALAEPLADGSIHELRIKTRGISP